MVTPYPPAPDGIGAYALQSVRRLLDEGVEVEVLSPGPSAAHHHLDLRGPRGALALARRVRRYDRLLIQFHPDVFYTQPLSTRSIAEESLALLAPVTLARHCEIRVHEVDYRWGQRRDMAGRAFRRLWQSVDRISVHTEREREDFVTNMGVRPDRVGLVPHGADFTRRTSLDRARARQRLGLDPDAFVFLSIGFIQPHKGFDRAVAGFGALAPPGAEIHVVGGVRVDDQQTARYLNALRDVVANTPNAYLHEGFISDDEFDRWIVACDVVVLPYRSIWSSGVMERAALLERPVIATDVGGLAHQARDRAVMLVSGDAELRAAMAAAAGVEPVVEAAPDNGADDLRSQLQLHVRRAATSRRGYAITAASERGTDHHHHELPHPANPLHDLPGLGPPGVAGSPLGRGALKRAVLRLTRWELDPIVHHVNALHHTTATALDELLASQDASGQRGARATSRTSDPSGQ